MAIIISEKEMSKSPIFKANSAECLKFSTHLITGENGRVADPSDALGLAERRAAISPLDFLFSYRASGLIALPVIVREFRGHGFLGSASLAARRAAISLFFLFSSVKNFL